MVDVFLHTYSVWAVRIGGAVSCDMSIKLEMDFVPFPAK